MPDPADLKQLLQLLAPGFVILGIRQWFVVGAAPPVSERALSYAAISAAYFAIVAPTIDLICAWLSLNDLTRDCWTYFYAPALLGLGYSWFAENDLPDRFWRFLRIVPVHRIPSAWDYVFRKTVIAEQYLVVTLTDGTQVAGYYGHGSFASCAREKGDLMISAVYDVDEDGNWTLANPPKSILLCDGDIRTVEIMGAKDER